MEIDFTLIFFIKLGVKRNIGYQEIQMSFSGPWPRFPNQVGPDVPDEKAICHLDLNLDHNVVEYLGQRAAIVGKTISN